MGVEALKMGIEWSYVIYPLYKGKKFYSVYRLYLRITDQTELGLGLGQFF